MLYVAPLWLAGVRTPPRLSAEDLRSLLPSAVMHAAGQMAMVASLGLGSSSVAVV